MTKYIVGHELNRDNHIDPKDTESNNDNDQKQTDACQDQVNNLIDLCQRMTQCTANLAVKIGKIYHVSQEQLPPKLDKSRYLDTIWNNLTKIHHKQELLVKSISKMLTSNTENTQNAPLPDNQNLTNLINHQKVSSTMPKEIKPNHHQANTNSIMDDISKNLSAYLNSHDLQSHLNDITNHLNLHQTFQELLNESADLRTKLNEIATKYQSSQATIETLQLQLQKLESSAEIEASALRFEASSDALEKQTALDVSQKCNAV